MIILPDKRALTRSRCASRSNGTGVSRLAAELTARNSWSREQLLRHQQQRLQETLRRAAVGSPFYRETIGHLVARGAPLEDLPVLTKAQLVANFDRIVTDRRLRLDDIERHLAGEHAADLMLGQYRACATGGTTGVRAVMVYDQAAWDHVMANTIRFTRLGGAPEGARFVGIGAPTPQHLSGRLYEDLRLRQPEVPRLNVTTPMPEVVAALNRYQPEIIGTYPSFIRRLAEEQLEGRLEIAPRLFNSVAEALMPDVRALARRAWGAAVFDRYSTTETACAGSECEHHSGIHLPEDLVIFEVVDEAGRRVPAGCAGQKLLVTTLSNAVLPLIRYELSDMVTLTNEPCICGRPYARITAIDGRREEVLRLPRSGGGRVEVHAFRLLSPLIGMPGVRQYQLEPGRDQVTVRISVRKGEAQEGIRHAVFRRIKGVLADVDAAETTVSVEVVDAIKRTGTGAKEKLVARSAPSEG
jgi:phenylacetate-coenzyme A ligase PaaK-like adenylate-forming protein